MIDELILSREDSEPEVWFSKVVVRRYQEQLYCLIPSLFKGEMIPWPYFPKRLTLGASMSCLQVQPSTKGLSVPSSSRVEVRFRVGGERFRWRGQTKLLKQLLQQWQVPPWMRSTLPLVYINDELACVVGYAVSDYFYKEQPTAQNTVIISLSISL